MASDEAQILIDGFVDQMVAGRILPGLSTDWPSGSCKVQLDRELTTLALQPAGAKDAKKCRSVPFEKITEIAIGPDAGSGAHLPLDDHFVLDDLCVTVFAEGGKGTFALRFEDVEDRDTFALVLGYLVDNHKSSVSTYRDDEDDTASTLSARTMKKASGSKAAKQVSGGELSQSQRLVKTFVEKHVKGRTLQMLAKTGDTVEILARLDRELTTMTIQRPGKQDKGRDVLLADIARISVGDESIDEVLLPVDEYCVTLILEGETVISFRFIDVEERDTFALCIGIFSEGNRKKQRRQKKR